MRLKAYQISKHGVSSKEKGLIEETMAEKHGPTLVCFGEGRCVDLKKKKSPGWCAQ